MKKKGGRAFIGDVCPSSTQTDNVKRKRGKMKGIDE
jgi:hypothetical protein